MAGRGGVWRGGEGSSRGGCSAKTGQVRGEGGRLRFDSCRVLYRRQEQGLGRETRAEATRGPGEERGESEPGWGQAWFGHVEGCRDTCGPQTDFWVLSAWQASSVTVAGRGG